MEHEKNINYTYDDTAETQVFQDQEKQEEQIKNRGEEILRGLAEKEDGVALPDTYHISAEHKALFSTVEDLPDTSNYPIAPKNHVTFTAFGLEYRDRRLPYCPEIQQEINIENTRRILKDSVKEEGLDLEKIFKKQNKEWTQAISRTLRHNYSDELSSIDNERKEIESQKKLLSIKQRKEDIVFRDIWWEEEGGAKYGKELDDEIRKKTEQFVEAHHAEPTLIMLEEWRGSEKIKFMNRNFDIILKGKVGFMQELEVEEEGRIIIPKNDENKKRIEQWGKEVLNTGLDADFILAPEQLEEMFFNPNFNIKNDIIDARIGKEIVKKYQSEIDAELEEKKKRLEKSALTKKHLNEIKGSIDKEAKDAVNKEKEQSDFSEEENRKFKEEKERITEQEKQKYIKDQLDIKRRNLFGKCKEKFINAKYDEKVKENDIMSSEELGRYNNFENNRDRLKANISEKLLGIKPNKPDQILDTASSLISRYILEYSQSVCMNKAHVLSMGSLEDKYISPKMSKLLNIKELENDKKEYLQNTSKIEKELDRIINDYMPKENLEEAKEQVRRLKKIIKEYYDVLKPKYLNAERIICHPTYIEEKCRLEQQLDDVCERKRIARLDASEKIKSDAEGYRNEIAATAFPGKYNTCKDVFATTTGITILTEDDKINTAAISPLSPQMLDMLSGLGDDFKENWTKIWTKRQNEADDIARRIIKRYVDQESPNLADGLDLKIQDISRKYQIVMPPIYNEERGMVYDFLQKEDIETLEDLLPSFGGFIKEISVDTSGNEVDLAKTRLEVMDYLAGGIYKDSMILVKGNCSLKLREIKKMFDNTSPEKEQKANARIAAELGISLYNNIPAKKRNEFKEMMGPALDISIHDFYKTFQKKIVSFSERRDVFARTLFLREFNRYLSKKSLPEMEKFFDQFKKKEGLGVN